MYTNIDVLSVCIHEHCSIRSYGLWWWCVFSVIFSWFTFTMYPSMPYIVCVSMAVLPVCIISISIAQAGKKQIAIPGDLKFRSVCQCDRNWRHFYIHEDLNNGNYLYIHCAHSKNKIVPFQFQRPFQFFFSCSNNKDTHTPFCIAFMCHSFSS